MTNSLYRNVVWIAGITLAALLIASHADAQASCTPNPYGTPGTPCLVEPPPAPCPDAANPYLSNLPCADHAEPEPDPRQEPPPTPSCPASHMWNPYDGLCHAPAPEPQPDPEPGDPEPDREPAPKPPAPVKPLWRAIPRAADGEPFAELVEQGPAADVEIYALRGVVPAFVWYQRFSGAYWLVVDGIYGPERVCIGNLVPGVNLVVLDLDADGQDDLLGHNVATGQVYRYYTRNLAACR